MTAALIALCSTALALSASPALRCRVAGWATMMQSGALTANAVADAIRKTQASHSGTVADFDLLREALAIVAPPRPLSEAQARLVEWCRNLRDEDCDPTDEATVLGYMIDDDAPGVGLAHLDEEPRPALPDDTWRTP